MIKSNWTRDIAFLGTITIACFLLGAYLMQSDQVSKPKTFLPTSAAQIEIQKVANSVDEAFQEQWQSDGLQLTAAPPASDLTIARRLSLGLAGTLPSLHEIREYEKQPESNRVHWLVSRLARGFTIQQPCCGTIDSVNRWSRRRPVCFVSTTAFCKMDG